MVQAFARFVQTGTQRSNATNWLSGDQTAWFNTTREAHPLITHTVSGSPTSISTFNLMAAGIWTISAGFKCNATTGQIRIRSAGNAIAASGNIDAPSVSLDVELNYNTAITISWLFVASQTATVDGDCNFVSFKLNGAV